jgi:hypothetical protein
MLLARQALKGLSGIASHRTVRDRWVSSGAVRAAIAPSDVVEIERKFKPSAELCARFAGTSSSIRRKSFIDVYWDDALYSLSTHDYWLRQRKSLPSSLVQPRGTLAAHDDFSLGGRVANMASDRDKLASVWELKFPLVVSDAAVETRDAKVDRYTEVTDERSIQRRLAELRSIVTVPSALDNATPASDMTTNTLPLPDWLTHMGIQPWGSITTHRTSYCIYHSSGFPLQIDVDDVEYDNGEKYSIGEVEVMTDETTTGAALQAEQLLHTVWEDLQLSATPVRGKVLEYLARCRPHHFTTLQACGFLASKGIQ